MWKRDQPGQAQWEVEEAELDVQAARLPKTIPALQPGLVLLHPMQVVSVSHPGEQDALGIRTDGTVGLGCELGITVLQAVAWDSPLFRGLQSLALAFPYAGLSRLGEPPAPLLHLQTASFPAKCSISSGQTHSCGEKGHASTH